MSTAHPASDPPDTPPVLSFVVPCYNEAANIRALYGRIRAVMAACPEGWECVHHDHKEGCTYASIELTWPPAGERKLACAYRKAITRHNSL